jgi:hypothetical protein
MKFKALIVVLFVFCSAFSQSSQCKVEIYLVNRVLDSVDFKVVGLTKAHLESNPLLSNEEILMYTIAKSSEKIGSKRFVRTRHLLKATISLESKVSNMDLQTKGARKFALLLNNEILYWGYLSSTLSSITPKAGVDARFEADKLELTYYPLLFKTEADLRANKLLLKCLKSTRRLAIHKSNGR